MTYTKFSAIKNLNLNLLESSWLPTELLTISVYHAGHTRKAEYVDTLFTCANDRR